MLDSMQARRGSVRSIGDLEEQKTSGGGFFDLGFCGDARSLELNVA